MSRAIPDNDVETIENTHEIMTMSDWVGSELTYDGCDFQGIFFLVKYFH
jgi:hypothetical protein